MGGGGGKSPGGSSGGGSTAETRQLAQQSGQLFNEANPDIMALLNYGRRALRKGGVGQNIPMVQQSVAQSKSALSDTLKALNANLASSGLGGTPFGVSTIADTTLKGNEAANQAGFNMANWFQQMLPGFVSGIMGTAMGGQTGASNAATQSQATASQAETAKGNQMTSMFSSLIPKFGFTKVL